MIGSEVKAGFTSILGHRGGAGKEGAAGTWSTQGVEI